MKYSTPFVVRLVCAVSLWICAAVTLGLSSEVESKINSRGFNTSWLPYIIFVGSFTLIFETIFLLIRLIATKSAGAWVIVDICWSVLMYFMWLASAIVVSVKVTICDDYGNQSNICQKIRAITAFAWIGWVLWWVVIGVLFSVGMSESRAGNKGVWRRPLPTGTGQVDYHDASRGANGVPATGEKLPRDPNDPNLPADGTTGLPTTNGTNVNGNPATEPVMKERPTV